VTVGFGPPDDDTPPPPDVGSAEVAAFAEATGIDLDHAAGTDVADFIRPDEPTIAPSERTKHMGTGEVLAYEPMTPLELTYALEEIGAAFDRYGAVRPLLAHKRYAAERAYIAAKANARLTAPSGGYHADREAYANLHSMAELEALHLAKELEKSADALFEALKSKSISYMSMSKANVAAQQSGGSGRFGA
jgi:hypothetical protein